MKDPHQHYSQKAGPTDQQQQANRQIKDGSNPTETQRQRRGMNPPLDHSRPIIGQEKLQTRRDPRFLEEDSNRIGIDHPIGVEFGHSGIEIGDHQLRPEKPNRPKWDEHRAGTHRLRGIQTKPGCGRQKRHQEEHQQLEVVVAHPVSPRGLHHVQVGPGQKGQHGRGPVPETQSHANRAEAQQHSDPLNPGRREERQPSEPGIRKMEGHLATGVINVEMRPPAGRLGRQEERNGLQQHHQADGDAEDCQGLRAHRAIPPEGTGPRLPPGPPTGAGIQRQ